MRPLLAIFITIFTMLAGLFATIRGMIFIMLDANITLLLQIPLMALMATFVLVAATAVNEYVWGWLVPESRQENYEEECYW